MLDHPAGQEPSQGFASLAHRQGRPFEESSSYSHGQFQIRLPLPLSYGK
jgi:hypothetical protein